MWIILSLLAIIFTVMNIFATFHNKDAKWFRYMALSLTALTLCAFYADETNRVIQEDWSGLMDVMPTMSNILWICTIVSILINSISLFKKRK